MPFLNCDLPIMLWVEVGSFVCVCIGLESKVVARLQGQKESEEEFGQESFSLVKVSVDW
jgi:hypothetical protein